ncbi:MAG: hypothetical protein JWP18_1524, partial [Solirubrobacterales bacterium]|nr:hypothetical protein [Solirubrobacterales bacterium]
TTGPIDSAAWIARLAKRAARDPAAVGALPLGRRRAPASPAAQAERMLSAVPGIGVPLARRILRELGSVAAVATADERLLRTVTGVGRERARRLSVALHEDNRARKGHFDRSAPKRRAGSSHDLGE